MELNELRKIAEAATPGPWQWGPEESHWGDCGPNLETVARGPKFSDGSQGAAEEIVSSWGHDANGIFVEDNDKAFIATFNPTTVLALLSRLEQAEQAVQRVRALLPDDADIREMFVVRAVDIRRALDGDGRRLADDALGGDQHG